MSKDSGTDQADPTVQAPAQAPQPMLPLNVTDKFSDLNPEDQIYRSEDGYLVKVKVLWADESLHGAEVFHVTGSIVGDDGKAKLRDNGKPAVHYLGRKHYLQSDAMADPTVGLERARIECVAETIRAEKHHAILRGQGVGMVSQAAFQARKAAEQEKEG